MKYVPLIFLPLVAFNAAVYGYVAALWWTFAAVSFVPVQGLVALLEAERDERSSMEWTALLVLWGAIAAWPVWQATVVFAVSALLVQIFRGRRIDSLVVGFCASAVISMPFVLDLDPWRSSTQDSVVTATTHGLFGLTCGLVIVAIFALGGNPRRG